jgi:hypothetical protein
VRQDALGLSHVSELYESCPSWAASQFGTPLLGFSKTVIEIAAGVHSQRLPDSLETALVVSRLHPHVNEFDQWKA